ncbi:DUF222 domain-containing protein [Gordonia sp. (in: high G+C Gram-positive bacteria)]|uniref:HNH endonuclease signature motif containing protein n=1 Tax=Gordonia sp. (in: high G+C Gram-positive bacteria) TaxID=84139 RepID=UPI0039E65F0C
METTLGTELPPLVEPGADEWEDSDWDRWTDCAHALDAAMCVTVGEPDWTLDTLVSTGRAKAMIAWAEYREIGAMHTHLSLTGDPAPSARGARMLDVEMQCAARIAMSQGITQSQADKWLSDAIAMRDRLPGVGLCLRDGLLSPAQFHIAVSRTELVGDQDWAPAVDTAIAARLRHAAGVWSGKRLRDMVDRIIFRHDPDSVRRRRDNATDSRCAWIVPGADGMATLGATMTAENAAIAYTGVLALAERTCARDPRSRDARSSDALFALVTGTRFECECGSDECDARIPEPDTMAAWLAGQQNRAVAAGKVLVHVVAEQATVDGRNDEPAFMDEHGVISAAHLRDILRRDDTVVRPLIPQGGASNKTVSLPTHLPSDPYRPSTALDTAVRARDGYCTAPGCDKPAWQADLDHIDEYDHTNPSIGGQTTADGLAVKCRMHHNLKTFGDGWLDDQYRTADGRVVTEVISPEGIHFPGPAETNQDLFPGINSLHWHTPTGGRQPARSVYRDPPRNRTQAKHDRRRAERQANRRHHAADGDPPF